MLYYCYYYNHFTALWTLWTLFGTTRFSRYQKGKTNLDFTEARDCEWQWHQLGHMQSCTLPQTDNHASTPPLSLLQARCPSCHPVSQQYQTMEGTRLLYLLVKSWLHIILHIFMALCCFIVLPILCTLLTSNFFRYHRCVHNLVNLPLAAAHQRYEMKFLSYYCLH